MLDLPTFACMNPVICTAPGLFRSVQKGRRASDVHLSHDHGRTSYEIDVPEQLGCDDLRILQAVIGLAGRATSNIGPATRAGVRTLRDQLELGGTVKDDVVLLVETSFSRLAQTAGYASQCGQTITRKIQESLGRLASCRLAGRQGETTWTYRLLSWDEGDACQARLRIAIDPHASRCVFRETRYTRIDLAETRCLKTDPARLLHHRLCAWIDAPKSDDGVALRGKRSIELETLFGYVWPAADGDTSETSNAARRARRRKVRVALDELVGLDWTIEKKREDLYLVRRPSQTRSQECELAAA